MNELPKPATVTWRSTKPLEPKDLICDYPECSKQADTIHFLPWVQADCEVLFACPDHDPGGYWANAQDLFGGNLFDQIRTKDGGWEAFGRLAQRTDPLNILTRVPLQPSTGPTG